MSAIQLQSYARLAVTWNAKRPIGPDIRCSVFSRAVITITHNPSLVLLPVLLFNENRGQQTTRSNGHLLETLHEFPRSV